MVINAPALKICLLQKFVLSTIAYSVSRTAWLCAMLCTSRRLRSPTPPPTDAITCEYAFVCRLHTVCVRSIYRLYAVSMLMGHLLGRYCSPVLGCSGRSPVLGCRKGLAGCADAEGMACASATNTVTYALLMPYVPLIVAYSLPYPIAYCIALHSLLTHCYKLRIAQGAYCAYTLAMPSIAPISTTAYTAYARL